MTPLAVVILTHADPVHFARLVAALEDTPIVAHCDARTPDDTFRRMAAVAEGRVRLAGRRRTALASWSLVQAELDGLREALHWTNARHIAVLSGADYPLVGMAELIGELDGWAGRSWICSTPLPHADWSIPRHPDGGLWRLRYRYLTRNDQVVFWRSYPLRWPVPRQIPVELTLRAASQWKIYCREDATALLLVAEQRPDLMRFWRTTLVPDECFAASILASRRLVGERGLPQQHAGAWYIDWNNNNTGHPRWLTGTDFDRLKIARWGTPLRPDDPAEDENGHRKLFARKFRSADAAVLDRIDKELRG